MPDPVAATGGQNFQIAVTRPPSPDQGNETGESNQDQGVDGARERQQLAEARQAERSAAAQRTGRVDVFA